MTTTLFLPMEVKHRELEGKTLLAVQAAKRGMSSVIGSMGMIGRLLPHLPHGVYVSKDVYHRRKDAFTRIKRLGHELVSWDEEGLIFRSRATYLRQSVSQESLAQCSRFFTWGDYQVEVLRSIIDDQVSLVPAGNPRFDLLRPEYRTRYHDEVASITRTHGRFVLIDTNFGHANNIRTRDELIDILKTHSTEFNQEAQESFDRFFEHDTRMFEAFQHMIPAIAGALPEGVNLVVRPHPIEKIEPYHELERKQPRMSVEREGGVIPWLLAAELLIHNSCTTGIESLLLGKPSLAYVPFPDEAWELNVSNTLSDTAESLDELIRKTNAALESPSSELLGECEARAKRFIASVDRQPATETILDAIEEVVSESAPPQRPRNTILAPFARCFLGTIGPVGKRVLRTITGRREHAYDTAKFSGLQKGEVEAAVSMLGAREAVSVSRIARGVYRIAPRHPGS